MTPLIFALVLGAAMLHATWNALLRGGQDRLWSITAMSFATTAVAIPWAALSPPPLPASWPWLAASALLQVGYSVFLVQAYRFGDLAQVYPIARGSAPLLVTLAAAAVAREHPSGAGLAGIALISTGIIGLARGIDRASLRSIPLACVTGGFIAAYTTVDGIGVRLSGGSGAYTAWLFLLYGALMPACFLAMGGLRRMRAAARGDTWRALCGGGLSLMAYAIAVYALNHAAIGAVSALRETSVVFAALLGHAFLGERLTPRRLLACVAIAAGVACIGWTA